MQTFIRKGKAILTPEGLRCHAAREGTPPRPCNKLLVKKTSTGQLAGNFKCERCGQLIEVELQP